MRIAYIDNTVLTFTETAEAKASIKESNEMIAQAKAENAYMIINKDFIRVSRDNIADQGYGFTGLDMYWWGCRIWLNRDDAFTLYNFCVAGVSMAAYLTNLFPEVGPYVAAIAEAIIAMGCSILDNINGGIWIDYNFVLGITGHGEQ